ncbi:hypothetical protein DFH06DRAFT_1140108 [Mycena polygramma]|nr:hypothetical protein DFH06DRAFT_1140108 [Mycena polygramma]
MLAYLRSSGSFALVNARYGRDFVATRDGSDGRASVFTFKDATVDGGYIETGAEKRPQNLAFFTTVFGAIRSVHELRDGLSLCLLVACPAGVSCDARWMFCRQVRKLKRVIEKDQLDNPGVVGSSWFDATAEGIPALAKRSVFFVVVKADDPRVAAMHKDVLCVPGVIGKTQLVVKFERREVTEVNILKKTYSIFVMQYDVKPYPRLPVVTEGYTCDRAGRTCIFCDLRRRGKLIL